MSNYFHRDDCRLCNGTELTKVLEIKPTPPANQFVTDPKSPQEEFPLDVYFCNNCFHVQLLDVVDPRILFSNYVYVSGTSPSFVKHFEDYANIAIDYCKLKSNSFVVEIGSNDGTMLNFFQNKKMRILGIDPAEEISRTANINGIETINSFFTKSLAQEILKTKGKCDLIVANNVFAHADNLDEIVFGIKNILKPDGFFLFEVSYLRDVFEKTLFDTIYHEHLSYHSLLPLLTFFEKHDMTVVKTDRVDTHGGSLRVFVQNTKESKKVDASVFEMIQEEMQIGFNESKTFLQFSDKILRVKNQLTDFLKECRTKNKKVIGFGAPAKMTTLMYHFDLGPECVNYIVDDNPLKQGLYSPGFHIPVVPSSKMYESPPDYVLVLAWNFADSIIKNHQKLKKQGTKFIVPLPKFEVI